MTVIFKLFSNPKKSLASAEKYHSIDSPNKIFLNLCTVKQEERNLQERLFLNKYGPLYVCNMEFQIPIVNTLNPHFLLPSPNKYT